MNTLQSSIPARYLQQLADMLEAQGTSSQAALAAAQIDVPAGPHATLTLPQADTLISALSRTAERQDLGFELGRMVKQNSHGELSAALISCATVEQSLKLMERYYRLVHPLFTLRYRRLFCHAEISIEPVHALPPATLRFYLEMQAVALHMQIMHATQGMQPAYDVHIGMAVPPHVERYRTLQPARFHFDAAGAPGVRIRLPSELLDKCLGMHDPRVLRQAELRCQQLLRELDDEGKWSDWVEAALRRAEDCQPSLDELARSANMSRRTLERHLMREGVLFRSLALRIRNERARQQLAEGKYPVSQIAYRLGYTDCANFSRWFKKLNGISPSGYMATISL